MRNLKKILAMVLALVMSLSLMATAGAADFPDVKEDTSFKTAIDVLSGLGVFNGYKEDGTFRPDGEITRAETAAIIYRIVTGDVKDEQVKIYSDYGLFKDVPANSWFAGYVNFCANAEYIKGDGKGNFNPNEKVEGYAALAMILRAIGYTANGGFTGSDWRVQTARVGEARKITKNITSGTLGSNADRKTVAEILYQAIMVDMVDHNVDNTFNGDQGYTTVPLTLGQKTFGLEYVSGVILANEWANLVGDEVLAADTTLMQVTNTYATQSKLTKDTDGNLPKLKLNDKTELEMQEALDAVGLTYDAHIANPTASTADVITLDKSDINVVAYNEGKGVYEAAKHGNLTNATWPTIEKLAEEEGLETDADTEWYVNYADNWFKDVTSEYRISYAIAKNSLNGLDAVTKNTTWKEYIAELYDLTNKCTIPTPAGGDYAGHYLGERTIKIDLDLNGIIEDDEKIECWVVAISPNNIINEIDQAIMERIFYTADRIGTNGTVAEQLQNYAVGEVYVGTTSMKDYSDTMSWAGFQEEYFNTKVNSEKFIDCEIGNSLRVIDNNGDGVAEYVLRIDYTQDKIIGTHKSQPAGYSVATGNFEGNLLYNPQADEIKQGTVFNYTEIDKKLYVWPAPVVTDSITNKNFQNITVTASNGEVYNQSGIENQTRLDENIMLMNQGTTYNMYMDVYGINIRSYDGQGGKYALLTEMYPTSDRNGNYVYDTGAIAEVKIGEADVTEYPVNNRTNNTTGNWFFNQYIWTWSSRNYSGAESWTGGVIPGSWLYNANYLQPAVAHLGIGDVKDSTGRVVSPAVYTGVTNNQPASLRNPDLQTAWGTWYRYVAQGVTYSASHNGAAVPNGVGGDWGVFDYRTVVNPNNEAQKNLTFSFTNVATYVDNDGTLTLGSASELARDRATGNRLYRVSTAAAAAVAPFVTGATDADKASVTVWGCGTEKSLIEAYDRATGTNGGRDWFNTWTSVHDGTGIYPIYDTDYVQLDLTKGDVGQALTDGIAVKAGTRHYHIDSDYSTLYNTNGNQYVDATTATEFYIVLPGGAKIIQYYAGYANLPTIEADKIRAAYAVAHNTSAQNNGQDYWVADVIVVELSELTYDYDSISLVYYNPYIQDNYTRYADTLNNEWQNLQPDYENKAMTGITPKSGFTDNGWGDWSWSKFNSDTDYGFYKLYQTELSAPGQMNVSTAKKITADFNSYGIYAGTVNRIEELSASGYLDVNNVSGATGSGFSRLIDIDYGEANQVPFYRITGTTQLYGNIYKASSLSINPSANWSDVKNGDELIWVYNKDQNRIAFVVDLGDRNKATGDSIDYDAPTWLTNLYNDIYNNVSTPDPIKYRTITFTRPDAVGTAAADLTNQKLTEIFDEIKIGASADNLVPMTRNDAAGTFTYTYDAAKAPALWYYELTFAPGFAVTATMQVGFTSDKADFVPSTATTGAFALDAATDNVVIELVDSTVKFDSTRVDAEQGERVKRNAYALIAEYVAAEIAKVADADDKAILEANVSLTRSVLKTAITRAEAAIDAEVDEYPGGAHDTLEKLQTAVNAIIAKNTEGVFSGSQKGALDTALTEQISAIDTARSEAASALQSKYLGWVALNKGDIVEDIYNNGVEAVNAALTTTAIETAETAATTAMDEAVAKASVPAPLPAEEAKAAIDQWYSDPNGGGKFAGIATYLNWSLTPEADGTTINFAGKVEGTTNVYNADYFTAGGEIPGFTADSVPKDATKFIIVPLYFYENNGQVNTLRFILVSDSATVTSRTDVDPAYVGTYLLTYDWSNIEW